MLVERGLQGVLSWLQCLRYVSALAAGVALALTASVAAALATEDVPQPQARAVHAALDAWSQFTATGDLSALGSSFVADGPQWRQFEAESAAWQAPTSTQTLRLELHELRPRHLDSTTATVWAKVKASRVGFVSEVFTWDFDLIHEKGRWQVWTVVAADEPPTSTKAPITSTSALTEATTTTTAGATPLAVTEAGEVERSVAVAGTEAPRGTRLPLLSAWIVVITVVGVAVAGYMAPRIDRRGEG